jgi:hypothetical protein
VLALSWLLVYIRDIKREEPQMANTQHISKLAKVSIEKAEEIHEVLLTEALIDFSEATTREYKKAISLATWFIDNGRSWE